MSKLQTLSFQSNLGEQVANDIEVKCHGADQSTWASRSGFVIHCRALSTQTRSGSQLIERRNPFSPITLLFCPYFSTFGLNSWAICTNSLLNH
jgi:hypothetical protein